MVETQPTPSAGTNKLIALAGAVLNGEEAVDELESALAAQMAIVSSELEMVPARAKSLGDAFLEEYSELYSALLTQMELYYEGLLELEAFFKSENPDARFLEEGVQRLLEVTPDLVAVQQAYGQVFSGHGPSRFPVVNTLDRLLAAYRRDSQVSQELEHVVAMIRETFQKRLQGLSAEEIGADSVRAGCEKAMEVLDRVRSGYTNHDAHGDFVKGLGVALFDLETAAEEEHLELMEGPACMPAANVLINTARRAMEGKLSEEAVGPAIRAYVEHVTKNWEIVESQLEKPIDSATIQEELPNTLELVDAHEEVMDRLAEIYENGFDHARFNEALEDLIEVVAEFQKSAKVFVEAASKVGKVVCVACGRANPRTNNACEQCGQALPKIVSDDQSDSTVEFSEHGGLDDDGTRMVMTTNLERIFKACDDLHEQRIGPEEFAATLEWAHGLLHQMRNGLGQLEAKIASFGAGAEEGAPIHEERNALAEVGAFFEEGIDEWEAGLVEMARYLDDPSPHYLRAGKKRVWDGASAIHRCKVIGDAAQERLKELQGQE